MLMPVMNVKREKQCGSGKRRERSKVKGEKSQRAVGCEVNVVPC